MPAQRRIFIYIFILYNVISTADCEIHSSIAEAEMRERCVKATRARLGIVLVLSRQPS
jgi:hypothetical protein